MFGIDITSISRFKNAKDVFIKKVLHDNEIKEYNNISNKEKYLAARWAIKEALFKVDNSNYPFSKIEISKSDRQYKYKDYNISTSSEGDIYIAIVSKEKDDTKK